MANTKVTQHVIANNAITADQLASAAVTDAKLHSTLDLSGHTLTLPATAIPSASTATTQSASDNSTKIATTAYVTTALANLVDSSPSSLNTLNELAAALNDDASFSTTVTNSLATKAPINNPTFTGSISHASDLTLDVGGDITLDAGGANINFNDDGTAIGHIEMAGQNLEIRSKVADKDLILKGNDGGSPVTALTLDMSEAGFAIFNSGGSFGGTGALKIPAGTTAQRPTAATGQIRWNSTDGALEVYNGTAWTAVGTGSSNKVLDTFTGNGSNRTFTLSVTPANEDAIMVFIDGAYQEKADYVLTNNSLVLDTAPLNNEKIAVHTTTASVHDGTSAVNQQFTATANQTDFTLSQDPKSENNTQVYINGVYQQKTDYTVTGTTLSFDTGLTVGDVVEVNMFTVSTLGNTDTVTEGVSNLYHTTARARGAISVSGNAISYNSSTGVLTANFEEGPVFTGNAQVNGTLAIGTTPSNVIGVYSTKSLANGLAAELSNTESSTGSGLVVKGGNNSSTYSADFRDYNGNSLMRVRGDGNVGIGTGAPGYKLHVAGTAHVTNTLSADSISLPGQGITLNQAFGSGVPTMTMTGTAANGRGGAINFQENGGANTAAIYSTDGGSGNASYGGLTIATYQSDLRLATNGLASTRMIVLSTGEVGIGTTSPSEELHVNSAVSGQHTRVHITKTTTAGTAGVSFRSKDATETWTLYQEDANASKFYIYDGANNVMTFDSANDRVGIGTDTPSKKLHIQGGGYDQIMINSVGGNNTNRLSGIAGLDYAGNQFSILQNFAQSGSQINYYGSADGSFRGVQAHSFYVNASSTATSGHHEAMNISANGYVKMNRNANEYGLELKSAGTRSGLVLKKPGTDVIQGSLLMLSDETLRLGTASVYNIHMNQSGYNTMPNQPVSIYTHSSNSEVGAYNYTWAGTGARTITLRPQSAVVNRGSMYNTSNGRWTAPVAGIYRYGIHGNLYTAGLVSNAYFTIRILKNGSHYLWHYESNGTHAANGWLYKNYSGLISLGANEYIEMQLTSNNLSSTQGFGWDLNTYTHYEFQLLY